MTTGNNPRPPRANWSSLTRVFDAPRSLVWRAWTDPQTPHALVGTQRLHLAHLQKSTFASAASICSVCAPPKGRISTALARSAKSSRKSASSIPIASPTHTAISSRQPKSVWMQVFSSELLITIVLEDLGDKTRLTIKHNRVFLWAKWRI